MTRAASLPMAFRHSQAAKLGISGLDLRALMDDGKLERAARGIYLRTDIVGAEPELAAIALLAPRATICLASALARHQLIDAIPSAIDVALPRGTRLPETRLPLQWHRFAPATFDVGRRTIREGGRRIGLYDPMRCIVDAFRLRHLEGHEHALDALKRWLRRRGSQPESLLQMARAVDPRAATVIRSTLEILL